MGVMLKRDSTGEHTVVIIDVSSVDDHLKKI